MQKITAEQITAFRWARHGLSERISAGRWTDVLRIAPIQDSPPGVSPPVALAARAELPEGGFADRLQDAWDTGGLLLSNAMRYAPLFCLPEDHAALTAGSAPDSPEGWALRMQNIDREIERCGMTSGDAQAAAVECMEDLLADGPIQHNDLCLLLSHRLPPPIVPLAQENQYFTPNLVLAACLSGRFLLRPRIGRERLFALNPAAPYDRQAARRRLARLFLRAYAPADAKDFARFAGSAPFGKEGAIGALEAAWEALLPGCEEVGVGRKTKLVLREDLPLLENPPPARGLRIVSAYDAYLKQESRDRLLPSPEFRKIAFPFVASPNSILLDGSIAGVARITKRPRALHCACDLFLPFSPGQKDDLEDAIHRIAAARGVSRIEITIAE